MKINFLYPYSLIHNVLSSQIYFRMFQLTVHSQN